MNHEALRYAHDEGLTDVCFSEDGSNFITCGVDGDLRLWPTDESGDPDHKCIGEWACSVRQKGTKLYVATGSNDVQILTFPAGERDGILDRFVAPVNQIAISKDSDHLALAGEDMEVKVVELGSGEKNVKILDGLLGPVLSVAINSRFVAASSGDGKLRVWSVDNQELLKEIDCFDKVNSFANAKALCRLDFEPKTHKFLAYPAKDSVVLLSTKDWSKQASLTCDGIDSYSIVQFSPCGRYIAATTINGDFVIFNVGLERVECSSSHPNNAAVTGLAWNPAENGEIVYTDSDGQLGVVKNCISASPPSNDDDIFPENNVDFGDIQFEDDEDNENAISLQQIKNQVMGDDVESELNFDQRSVTRTPRPRTPVVPQQEAFMPGSSPEHLNPRYLCWNEVGVVKSYGDTEGENSYKSIEVEFHDATLHSSMIVQNYQDYRVGSVSKAALVLANTKQIHVIPLKASSKEWNLKLDEGPEEIVLVASSEHLVSFAMSNYNLRICSVYGTQMAVISIPGAVVSMASSRYKVLVAYHSGPVSNKDQNISLMLINLSGFSVQSCSFEAALSPESTLAWVGFSDVGTVAAMDSAGFLSFYSKGTWLPICDTSKQLKSPSDFFFATAVEEAEQSIIGIKCRGSVYPGFTPRPTACQISFEPPFLELSTDKTQLEANLFACSNFKTVNSERKVVENGLKAFVLACKSNLDQRAVELMELLGNPQLLELSTKYATKLNKKLMAEKLMEIAAKLTANEDSEDEPDMLVATPLIRPLTQRIPLKSLKRLPMARKPVEEVCPSSPGVNDSNTSVDSSLSTTIGEPMISLVPRNPFVKKKAEEVKSNPLSLVNKTAGVDYEDPREKRLKGVESEKRKQPDSATEKQREKQRKLDKFMFSKPPKH